jgi:hypothetical protein
MPQDAREAGSGARVVTTSDPPAVSKRPPTPRERWACELLRWLYDNSPLPWSPSIAARQWGVRRGYGQRAGSEALTLLAEWRIAYRPYGNAPWEFVDRHAARRVLVAKFGFSPQGI